MSTRKTSDNRDNEYEFWPARNDHSVPRKYAPAPNERLLVEHTEYPAEFERLVRATVEGDRNYQDAVIEVLVEMLVGQPRAHRRRRQTPPTGRWSPTHALEALRDS